MKKQILTLSIAFASLLGYSQTTYIHHSPDDCVSLTIAPGDITSSVIENPETGAVGSTPHTDVNVYSYLAAASSDFMAVTLPEGVNVGDNFTLRFKYYTASTSGAGSIIVRLYNNVLGRSSGARISLPNATKTGGEWQEFEYTTDNFPQNDDETIDASNLINRIQINPANNATAIEALLIDDIEFEFAPTAPTILPATATLNDVTNQWVYNDHQDIFNGTLTNWAGSTTHSYTATPTTTGNESSDVLEVVRAQADATTGLLYDDLTPFSPILGDKKVTFRIYPVCNYHYFEPNVRIRVRDNGASGTQIQHDVFPVLTPNVWNEVSLDMSDSDNWTQGVQATSYNQIYISFDQGDNLTAPTAPVYYIDAIQTPQDPATASVGDIATDAVSLNIYPTLVDDTFKINAEIVSADIYNITGQKVKTYGAQTEFDASGLAKGIYFFQANLIDGSSETIRFVKK